MCDDEYVLSSDGTTCGKTCELDEYLELSHFDDDENNQITGGICTKCNSTCKTCLGESAESCSSCNEGNYLSIVSVGGTCGEKSNATGVPDITILVLNSANKDYYSDDTATTMQADFLGAMF